MYEIILLFRVMNSVPVVYGCEIFLKKIVWVRKFLITLCMGTKKNQGFENSTPPIHPKVKMSGP